MDIKDVRQWNCANGKAVAVNPSFDNIGKYPPLESDNKNWNEFNRWSSDPANQPTTELTGIYGSEQVEVVEVWEYEAKTKRGKVVFNEVPPYFRTKFDSYYLFKLYCEPETKTRLTYTLIKKEGEPLPPVIGEETVEEAAENSLMLDSFDEQRPYTSGFINGAKWLKKQYENRIDARNS